MLIVALVLAVIGLAALVAAVVTSNELIAWVCIAASAIGVVLLIVDALRERSRGQAAISAEKAEQDFDEEYPDEAPVDEEPEITEAPTETVDGDTPEVAEEDSSNPR